MKIGRKLQTTGNKIIVPGDQAGGGIVMTPKTPETVCPPPSDCPASTGGDCAVDTVVSQWIARAWADSTLAYQGTSTNAVTVMRPCYSYRGIICGALVDLSQPVGYRPSLCGDVTWDVTVDGDDLYYSIVSGMFFITGYLSEVEANVAATPSVNGVQYDTLHFSV